MSGYTQASPTELLPCPFCGGEADIDVQGAYIVAFCRDCGVCPRTDAIMRAEAVEAWNRRAHDPR